MNFYKKTDIISSSISFLGFYDWELSDFIKVIAKDSKLMIDVGANLGYYSLIFLANSDKGYIEAYEPNRVIFLLLDNNIQNNNLEYRSRLHNVAVSNKSEKLLFDSISTQQGGWGRISQDTGITVTAVSLDDEYYNNEEVVIDILKIDVEGYEYKVILGATKLLSSHRIKHIFFEINEEMLYYHETSKEELESLFISYGYQLKEIKSDLVYAFL
jgi:FkbM family methyltransferase